MKLTQAAAAKAAGVSRTEIWRAIKSGRLSAEKLDDGAVRIDASELMRVWPKADLERAGNKPEQVHGDVTRDTVRTDSNGAGNGLLQALTEELSQIRQERDQLRAKLEAAQERAAEERGQMLGLIEEQTRLARSLGNQVKLLTDQRERRPWWLRVLRRT